MDRTPLAPPYTSLDEPDESQSLVLPDGASDDESCDVVGCDGEPLGNSAFCISCQTGVDVASIDELTQKERHVSTAN